MKPINAFRLVVVVGVVVYALSASGCAVAPNTVRVEFDHSSHMTQHPPFSGAGTNYGSNVGNVVAHWDAPGATFVEVGEGISLDRHYRDINAFGEIIGPREQFTLRIGKTFRIK